jgi:hypothetical protein
VNRRRYIFAFALGAATCAGFGGSRGAAQSAPNALYDAAYDRWRALPVAPFTTFDSRFVLVRNGKTSVRLYTIAYRSSDRLCRITGVPLDAHDRPDPPTVTRRCLTPGFAFTFVPQASSDAEATGLNLNVPSPDPSETDSIKTITSVRARSRPYAVTLVGSETIDGIETTHLALHPYRTPDKHVLRDLWIDPVTDGVVKLRGEATAGANLVHVTFEATYLEDRTTQTLVRVDAFAKAQLLFMRESGDVSFELTDQKHPETLPDALFSRDRKH